MGDTLTISNTKHFIVHFDWLMHPGDSIRMYPGPRVAIGEESYLATLPDGHEPILISHVKLVYEDDQTKVPYAVLYNSRWEELKFLKATHMPFVSDYQI